MSDMTLFEGGNSLASSDLFKQLQDTDDNLSGGTGGQPRNDVTQHGLDEFRPVSHSRQGIRLEAQVGTRIPRNDAGLHLPQHVQGY